MTEQEFAKFAMTLKTFFPRDNLIPNKEAMELWFRMLHDVPYELANAFIQKWTLTEKWSPSIAEIRQGCMKLVEAPAPDWGAGWSEVIKAIGMYGYMQEEKALAHMSPITRQVVERLGWKQLCWSDNEVADRANFRNCYEAVKRRAQEDKAIPKELKETINQLQLGAMERRLLDE